MMTFMRIRNSARNRVGVVSFNELALLEKKWAVVAAFEIYVIYYYSRIRRVTGIMTKIRRPFRQIRNPPNMVSS